MKIGELIKNKRTEMDISQEKLSLELGFNKKSICQIESCDSRPRYLNLLKIADRLNISIAELSNCEDFRYKNYQLSKLRNKVEKQITYLEKTKNKKIKKIDSDKKMSLLVKEMKKRKLYEQIICDLESISIRISTFDREENHI